jgi:quercetin dioxygenase-like cupin family protein
MAAQVHGVLETVVGTGLSLRLAFLMLVGGGMLTGCAGPASPEAGGPEEPPESRPKRASFVQDLPETYEYVRLLSPPQSVAMRSGLVTLQTDEDCGWHSTDNYEEMVVCLEGEGEVEAEGSGRSKLGAGQVAYNAPHTRHCVFNTGSKPMRYVYVVAPAPGE